MTYSSLVFVRRILIVCVGLLIGSTSILADELSGVEALKAAVVDLNETFEGRYVEGPKFLKRLDQLVQRAKSAKPNEMDAIQDKLESLRREALMANPLVNGQPILFVVRCQYKRDHHNTATMFQTGEINTGSFQGGSALKRIDLADGKVTTLLELKDGVIRDPDVHFDGKRVLFAMRRDIQDDYHLYEINVDGSGLVQRTFGSGISDIDPIYLPDDRILCTSTREPKFCMCNRHIMGNLFTMDADGANIQQIGHSTLHEGHASLMPDGRIIYDRWEYIDRNFGDAQGTWCVNPDGTNHAVHWGNNTNSPGAVLDARAIPGTDRFLATFSSCHDRPWGALAMVDRRLGLDGKTPVVRTWPPEAIDLVDVGNYDTFKRVAPKYEDPYPLSEKHFLCSRMIGQGEQMGVFLVDTFGNVVCLHTEEPGCFDPLPVAKRTRPATIPSRIDLTNDEGYFYVADVYQGTGMDSIERGTVKYVRVVESPEKRFWTQQGWNGSGTQAPGMAWDDFNNKQILGTVDVNDDGSAYFAVPADTWVYFQLLDASGRMVQSMRSGTIARPGERAGCVGCHDNRRGTIPISPPLGFAARSPQALKPWYGPKRTFGYLAEVQPALDRHCVSCHDYGNPAGEKLNLAGDLLMTFNTSYVELRKKKFVKVVGAGPYQVQKPKSWGSHASRLAQVLVEGHGDPKIDDKYHLSPEDFDRIITWIDINAPYYPEYSSAYRKNRYGRSPLDPAQVNRLNTLTGLDLNNQGQVQQVNFTRPEMSPCLSKFSGENDPKYREALDLIDTGRKQLAKLPRADMKGFCLVDPIEISQESKYRKRLAIEAEMRRAIARGEKRYEKSPTREQ